MFYTQRGYIEYINKYDKYQYYSETAGSSKNHLFAANSIRNRIYRVDCLDIINCPDDIDFSNEALFEFFSKVVPETGDSYYIQRQMDYNPLLGKAVFFSKYKSRADFINNLIFATKQKQYTVFYSANSYIKDRGRTAKNKRGLKAKSLIIDIDGIAGIENLNEGNIEEFLMRNYFVTQDQLPNYICFSGHGLHLYYILSKETDNDDVRKEVHKNLVNLFIADPSCTPFCHCFRVPGSYNLKNNNVIQSRLYKTSNEKTYNINDFQWVEDILESEDYLEKALLETEKFTREKANKPQQKADKKPVKQISETAVKINEDIINFNNLVYESHDNANSRNKHLLIDLHNYYVRHNGLVIGVRHNFFMILANVLKSSKYNKEAALKYFKKYIPESHSFYSEAISDLNRVFANDITYHLKNQTIADWLNFTQQDYDESFGFTEESKKAITSSNNKKYCKKYYERNKRDNYKRNLKEEMRTFIAEHRNEYKNKELAEMFECSESTIKRIKNKIKSE